MIESLWNGYKRIDFLFEGRECILVFPNEARDGREWLLKTEYFEAFPSLEIEMLGRGWHLAYIKNVTRWCLDEDLDLKDRFAAFLHEEYKLSEKCVPVGMSCGGLIACKFAAKYPHRVSALYLDAPVMNLLSCPAKVGRGHSNILDEFIGATGITLSDLLSYREHPIDKMHVLFENNIPIALVYGDSDEIVPYHENGFLLEKYYKARGGSILAIGKAGCGHHPHCLEDNTPVIEFIEKCIH
ncbi:MAG: alpha/beta fold hydrolase [Clostridia bacterium]|nr:alpha/beta fold hydrolase [Clostridia bacterium]